MKAYNLVLEMPFRAVSVALVAETDAGAIKKASDLIWSSCTTIADLDHHMARLQRADGSDVLPIGTVAALAAKSESSKR